MLNALIFPSLFFLLALVQPTTSCRHNGLSYRNGEEWEERGAFVMRCTINDENGSWKTEVVACVLPTTGRRIPINTSVEEQNDEWKCQMNQQGMVTLVQGASPNAKCDGRSVGSRWQEKSFELECRPGGIRRLVACVTEDGQRIPVNGSKEVNGFTLVCQQFGNGTVVFHGAKSVKPESKTGYRFGRGGDDDSPSNIRNRPGAGRNTGTHSWASPQQAVKCVDENGYQRNIGEHWLENHRFNKTCRLNGAVEVVNCVSKDGYRIPLNGQLIRDGSKYSCEMTSQGTIRFAAGPVDDV
ncbi:major allergen [Ditylenchus destructor]|uniref:Major allergen n=1 Tax=Ditylenchus destructor TaxID=166010 RepID=A0AAD4NB50_9BILA|nr:major allergen [Ditylenchus destructor]